LQDIQRTRSALLLGDKDASLLYETFYNVWLSTSSYQKFYRLSGTSLHQWF